MSFCTLGKKHAGEAVLRLRPPPQVFCEALALALEIPPDDFRLGRTKMFFRAGAGAKLEELMAMEDTEAISILMAKSEYSSYGRRR